MGHMLRGPLFWEVSRKGRPPIPCPGEFTPESQFHSQGKQEQGNPQSCPPGARICRVGAAPNGRPRPRHSGIDQRMTGLATYTTQALQGPWGPANGETDSHQGAPPGAVLGADSSSLSTSLPPGSASELPAKLTATAWPCLIVLPLDFLLNEFLGPFSLPPYVRLGPEANSDARI